MLKITSKEFQNNIRMYQDRAVKEPIIITLNDKKNLVLFNHKEYKLLRKRQNTTLKVISLTDIDS